MNNFNIIYRDDRVRDYVLPAKIAGFGGGVSAPETLLRRKPLQIAVREADCMAVDSAGFVVLDFGREFSGGARILTHLASGICKARLRFGESLSETYSDIIGTMPGATATNDHSNRDFTVELSSFSDMAFGQTGFRFLRIDFLSGFEIRIKSVIGVFEHLDLKRLGSFECSDPLVNRIFDTAAYTVELCMQSMIWDGIKRDRLVWIGDLHPETLAVVSLFGAHPCIERALEYEKDLSPLPGFMNNMAAYSLWWLCILSDYYLHNCNIAFVRRHKDYIAGLVKLIDSLVDTDGTLNFSEEWNGFFLDWPTANCSERKAGVYALCTYAMEKAELLLRALDLDTSITASIRKRLKKDLDGGIFKQVNAFKVLAGHIAPAAAANGLLSNGARGMSTFMSYYILFALSEAGKTSEALAVMKEYYGAMLSRGATTFWEDFDIDWLAGSNSIDSLPLPGEKDIHGDFGAHCYKGFRHSLCHGWSCGPVPFLMHRVLGIKELESGCKKVEIKPDLCGLEWAKGTYPTPYGNIEISLKSVSGKAHAEIKASDEIVIVRI